MRFLRDRTIHAFVLVLKRLHYGEFYLQWRPADELRSQRLRVAKDVIGEWCRTSVGLGQDSSRVYMLLMNILRLDDDAIPGAFAEVGVYKGYTARILVRLAGQRLVYLFDTFAGFDPADLRPAPGVGTGYAPPEIFKDTSVESVRRRLGGSDNVVFCVGRFPASAAGVRETERFALVHFDADLYEPARSACEFFYPRMSPGGLMIFHNYNDPDYPGTKRAVDEFFSSKPEGPVAMPDQYGSAVVVRSK